MNWINSDYFQWNLWCCVVNWIRCRSKMFNVFVPLDKHSFLMTTIKIYYSKTWESNRKQIKQSGTWQDFCLSRTEKIHLQMEFRRAWHYNDDTRKIGKNKNKTKNVEFHSFDDTECTNSFIMWWICQNIHCKGTARIVSVKIGHVTVWTWVKWIWISCSISNWLFDFSQSLGFFFDVSVPDLHPHRY